MHTLFASRTVLPLSIQRLNGVSTLRGKPGRAEKLTAHEARNPLRQWRLKQPPEGWKRSVLARQLGVSHTSVEGWEKGKRLPVVDAFAKIEQLTGITTRQWMDWYNAKEKARASQRGRSV